MSSVLLRRLAASESPAHRASTRLRALRAQLPEWRRGRTVRALLVAACSGPKFLNPREIAQRIAGALVSVLFVGSVIVVPVACLLALVCAAFPSTRFLRHITAETFALAIVWFTIAVFGAHLQPRPPQQA